jgi:hypothetical protein
MDPQPVSALPSVRARVAAFAAIILAGVCGALIGRSIVTVGCHGSCATPRAAGTLVGAIVAAGGVAIVVVLVLRALGEWRVISADPGPRMPGAEDFDPDDLEPENGDYI